MNAVEPIVLDNCEHFIDTAALLAERLLRGAPSVHIIATSRESLRAKSERVLRLAPLELPPPGGAVLTAAEALGFPAIQLFAERATGYVRTARCRGSDRGWHLPPARCRWRWKYRLTQPIDTKCTEMQRKGTACN